MDKQVITKALALSLGIGTFAGVVCSQLDIKLDEQERAEASGSAPKPYEPQVLETVDGPVKWDSINDIIVVGSGAAGLMAGVSALWSNPHARVVILEKAKTFGGTTAKSGGVFWLPDNVLMRQRGIQDSKERTVKFLCKVAFPDSFKEAEEFYGLREQEYLKIAQYYDLGYGLSSQLQSCSPNLNLVTNFENELLWDYQYNRETDVEDNVAPQGRHLGVGMSGVEHAILRALQRVVKASLPALRKLSQTFPSVREITALSNFGFDLHQGLGIHLVQVLSTEFTRLNGIMQASSVVNGVILANGQVVGVRIFNAITKEHEFIGAKRGVIFASGGFSHNQDLVGKYLSRNHLERSGAVKDSDGVLVTLANKLDLSLNLMNKIWGCEVIYDPVTIHEWETPTCLFQMRGDSFFVVGPNGKRIHNEKMKYDLRARTHWSLSREDCEAFDKGVFFMICDHRCIDLFGGEVLANTWPRNPDDYRYIRGKTVEALAENIYQKFPQFVSRSKADFAKNLLQTLQTFNNYAIEGFDREFHRGTDHPSDQQLTTTGDLTESLANRSMFPLSGEPCGFFALPIVASVIDTKGGPRTDARQRVLKEQGEVVDRLYACGNAGESIMGDAYYSGGTTLGAALVSGYVAGITSPDEDAPILRHLNELGKKEDISELLQFAKAQKQLGKWSPAIHGSRLGVILFNHSKNHNRGEENLDVDFNKILGEDAYQHTCNLNKAISIFCGWICVFTFCHVPWIFSLVWIYNNYQAYNWQAGPPVSPQVQLVCQSIEQFIFGFIIIFAVNLLVGLAIALAKPVDSGNNSCTKNAPYILGFLSISVIGYNIYGVVVVWSNDVFYSPNIPGVCQDVRNLSIAIICFFFLIPLFCHLLVYLTRSSKPPRDDEDVV